MNSAQSKRRTRTLIFENKLYKTNLFGESVEVTTGSVDEKRSTTKHRIFDDSNAALSWTIDQERKKLRQGFTIDNPGASTAEPRLVMRVTNNYTGLLPVATYSYGLLTAFTDSSQKDIVIDIDGTEAYEVAQIDTGMVSKIMEFDDNIYLLVNHQVMKVHADGSIVQLTNMGEHPISALEIAAGRAVWLDKGDLVLTDLESGKVLWSQSLQPIKQNGHMTQFAAALSDHYLVYCDQPKKVVVHDLITKTEKTLVVDAEMIQHMVLVGDQLYVSELYGEWSVRCYDIANERPAASWKPIVEREQHPLALSANHDYLAIGSGTSINIYDLASHKAVARIDVDYAVKRVEFAWNDANQLAVRLDSGLISLYQVF